MRFWKSSKPMENKMVQISSLMNMGPKTQKWLHDINIHTEEDLHRVGVVTAYCQLKVRDPQKVNLRMLWAMQGALMGINLIHLPQEIKDSLKEELFNF